MAKHNTRRIEIVYFYCRACWRKGSIQIEWLELEGKTLEELRTMCNNAHQKICSKADVRLGNATKTRRSPRR